MQKYFFILSFLLVINNALSQPISCAWLNRGIGDSSVKGNAIAKDSYGNIYVAGSFSSAVVNFGSISLNNYTTTGNPFQDIYVVKYNNSGVLLWAKSYGGNDYDVCSGIACDNVGNVILCGYFASDSIAFGNQMIQNEGIVDVFILKLNESGNEIWAIGAGSNSNDYSYSVAVDFDNNVYLSGSFDYGTISFGPITLPQNSADELFLVKFDSNGNVLWAKSAGGGGAAFINSMATDSQNNIIVAGDFGSYAITFGSVTIINSGFSSQDGFIVKYDTNGNVIWGKNGNCSGEDYLYGVATDLNDNIYFTGCFDSPGINFDTLILSYNGNQNYNIYVAQYNSNGVIQWAQGSEGGCEGQGRNVTVDASGNTYLTGEFYTTNIKFGGIADIFHGGFDAFLVKFNQSGNPLWVKSYGGDGLDYGNAVLVGNGAIYLTGNYSGSAVSFSNCVAAANNFDEDMYIVKLNAITGLAEVESKINDFTLTPNPASENIVIHSATNMISKVILYGSSGNQISEFDGKNNNNLTIELNSLKPALYFIKIFANDGTITHQKLTII